MSNMLRLCVICLKLKWTLSGYCDNDVKPPAVFLLFEAVSLVMTQKDGRIYVDGTVVRLSDKKMKKFAVVFKRLKPASDRPQQSYCLFGSFIYV